ncbi:hypothetical protein MMC30_007626 [Trapelia coarctata]|nr:hypothetical protein [Trapelia coarctata]
MFESDTATLHHPIQASIETTQASLARGDWGLKRSLPQQSTTATTTPVIRIGAIDSIDHITDFDSAADHTLTLRKWQEMNIPITLPSLRVTVTYKEPPVSVFEDHLDRTEVDAHGTKSNPQRWKYGGPWLAGKTNGEFEEYILKKVKGRRQEFRQFLRAKLHEKLVVMSRRVAMDKGEVFQTPLELPEEDFEAAIIQLRHNNAQLMDWIWQFLDLPRLSSKQQKHIAESWLSSVDGDRELEQGPPITHPSAGLSYLRTSAHVPNHPILGPMHSQPPVLARILQQASSRGTNRTLLGVGGVVGEDTVDRLYKGPKSTILDPNSEGGPKGWMHPHRASIDPRGRIQLGVGKATDDSVALWEKQIDLGLLGPSSMGSVEMGSSKSVSYRKAPRYDTEGLSDISPPVQNYLPKKASEERTSLELRSLLKIMKT